MPKQIRKRDGCLETWSSQRIAQAILKALKASGVQDPILATRLAGKVSGADDTFAPFEISSSVWLVGPSGEKVTYQMGDTLDGANDGLQELLAAGFFAKCVAIVAGAVLGWVCALIGDAMRRFARPNAIFTSGGPARNTFERSLIMTTWSDMPGM